jgi:hypothetical protein
MNYYLLNYRIVGTFRSQHHTKATVAAPLHHTGQTGRREILVVDLERRLGRDPVGASAHRVALGSARPP